VSGNLFEISPYGLMISFANTQKMNLMYFFFSSFWLDPKVPPTGIPMGKRSRLNKNFWFSTGRIVHAIQASPTHRPALASVSLTKGQR